ncbi:TPA: AraC family transcriptional regulator [Escherichia coli]|uniref:AraC family transcriptional regulator n=1 Tax=Escherichia coli TaxID=562 RepID=UPI000BE5B65E|nr:AraC family transcriptional regulator [Escherichia coli]EEY7959297.1 AraC family transcriptional regulator [Escherichia coli]EFJ3291246.1 AraC family transcriptional regulator [Escherichia coli]EFN7002250.1 AraC family transcriptional regulator [Escherichia coli]EGO4630058.1 AraC family transcriptional regulator [Escherichia coli]EIV8827752.1 AraC family transcriptional regulator [Escherichia coli]
MNTENMRDKLTITDASIIAIDSITTNKYLIVYTDNCDLTIHKNNQDLFFPQGTFVFIERGIKFSCKINKKNPEKKPYRAIRLDKEELIMLKEIFKSTHSYYLDEKIIERKPRNKIVRGEGYPDYARIFDRIVSTNNRTLKILKLAYIISRMGIAKDIIHSLIASAAITFTDKVRSMIEKDTSRKWRINMIADEFNISEISVRKRLESEGMSFNNLLVDVRMNKAMQLLLENEQQIHQISKAVGILSPSYFIKSFKYHFGITPKQFIIYFRE